jgi:hypothetical protein
MMVVVATSVPLLSREVRTLERRDLTSASS